SEKLAPSAVAQDGPSSTRFEFAPVARSPRGRYVFRNVTAHPVARPAIEDAVVVVDSGKITLVAPAASVGKSIPNDAVVIDGKGLHLYPGMIDSATVLGLTELGSARE